MDQYAGYRSRYGALPSQVLRQMMNAGMVKGADSRNTSPASLDLSLSGECYEVRGILQAMKGEVIADLAKDVVVRPHPLAEPLIKGRTYLIRLNESLALPPDIYGYCNPKSSTGRLDMHVRVLADGSSRYDSVPRGYHGPLWVSITPRSFSVALAELETLTQLRLFTGDTRISELELSVLVEQYRLLWHPTDNIPLSYSDMTVGDGDGGLILSVDISGAVAGYVSKDTEEAIDLSRIGGYRHTDFFEELIPIDGTTTLLKDHFYILSTAERVRIPPILASEMVPMDERSGDLRSHYAGFLDPGWGWGLLGEGFGRPFTLEVRPFENIIVRHLQPIAKIRFEYMTAVPDVLYDTKQSHYLSQSGPRLGKQFASN